MFFMEFLKGFFDDYVCFVCFNMGQKTFSNKIMFIPTQWDRTPTLTRFNMYIFIVYRLLSINKHVREKKKNIRDLQYSTVGIKVRHENNLSGLRTQLSLQQNIYFLNWSLHWLSVSENNQFVVISMQKATLFQSNFKHVVNFLNNYVSLYF